MKRYVHGNCISPWCLVLAVWFLSVSSPSFAQVSFERTYGDTARDAGKCVHQTLDGGYIVVGWTDSPGPGQDDVYLIRTDSLGDVLWVKTYGGSVLDWGNCVQQTLDGGYFLVGETSSFGAGGLDFYVIKTDALGNVLWEVTYGETSDDVACCGEQTSDGGYIIAGGTSFGANRGNAHIIKTHSLGGVIWERTYSDNSFQFAYFIRQTLDGGYVFTGQTCDTTDCDVYLVKTDSLGNTLWERTFGGSSTDVGYAVQQTPDSGYVVAGWTLSFGAGGPDFYLIKTDPLGNAVWQTTYGGIFTDEAHSVYVTAERGYAIAGVTNSFGSGDLDVYLVKTDSLGNTVWERTYGGNARDEGWWVQQTADGGYVVAGGTDSYGHGRAAVYLIKTDENGNVGVAEGGPTFDVRPRPFKLGQNFPNPFCRSTVITYSVESFENVVLVVTGAAGGLVGTVVNGIQNPGLHQVRWDAGGQPSGIYFCRLQAGGFSDTKKMILLR